MEEQIIEGIEQALTPIPRNPGESITMDFPSAIREIIKGKKVTRIEWGNTDYGVLKDEWLSIYRNGKFHTWLISEGDLSGQDWIVVIDATKN